MCLSQRYIFLYSMIDYLFYVLIWMYLINTWFVKGENGIIFKYSFRNAISSNAINDVRDSFSKKK